jgi:hypothetical protein
MPERHTVDFDRFGVNILSDAEVGTISLQFEKTGGAKPIGRMMKAIERRFGSGIWARLDRWRKGQGNPLVLSSRGEPHPENPDVIRLEMTVQQGERMDGALAVLMEFLRREPEYRRTLGPPLDRDHPDRLSRIGEGDASGAAAETLRRMIERSRLKGARK